MMRECSTVQMILLSYALPDTSKGIAHLVIDYIKDTASIAMLWDNII